MTIGGGKSKPLNTPTVAQLLPSQTVTMGWGACIIIHRAVCRLDKLLRGIATPHDADRRGSETKCSVPLGQERWGVSAEGPEMQERVRALIRWLQ